MRVSLLSISLITLLTFGEINGTLNVVVKVSEGLVLATDSRSTYRNVIGDFRTASDNADKLIQLGQNAACLVSGEAFFAEWTVKGFIESFRAANGYVDSTVIDISRALEEFKRFQASTLSQSVAPKTEVVFAGYTLSDSAVVYRYSLTTGKYWPELTGQKVGLFKTGQTGAIDRLLRGNEIVPIKAAAALATEEVVRLLNECADRCSCKYSLTDSVRNAIQSRLNQTIGSGLNRDMKQAESIVLTDKMYLQDATDYARFLIRLSIDFQRFTDGTKEHPGDVQGIGGEIDVATISPSGFTWVSRKSLK